MSTVLLGNGDGTFQPPVTYAAGRRRPPTLSRATSPATAASTWPSRTSTPATSRCCWAKATARSRSTAPSGRDLPDRHRGRGLHRRRPLDLAVVNGSAVDGARRCDDPAGQRRRHVPAALDRPLANAVVSRRRSWRAISTATAAPTWPSPTRSPARCRHLPGQRRRHVREPRSPVPAGAAPSRSWRATSTATAGSTWPWPINRPGESPGDVTILLGNGDGTFSQRQRSRSASRTILQVADRDRGG